MFTYPVVGRNPEEKREKLHSAKYESWAAKQDFWKDDVVMCFVVYNTLRKSEKRVSL